LISGEGKQVVGDNLSGNGRFDGARRMAGDQDLLISPKWVILRQRLKTTAGAAPHKTLTPD